MFYDYSGGFAGKPRVLRFCFYLISSFKLMRYSAWVQKGEPNPFVRKDRRPRETCQIEITDIFGETLRQNNLW